ncbi:Copia protein [Vitis vinifera]|uniref:Copia protein n=1 Tax=Vitis vinifera TaxID=29760 RepID=A0A438BYG2_VITVI|nr:Copia protein [Vitis vinifera]
MYIDDIILTRDYEEEISKRKDFLAKEFEIKDLVNLKYFLGMEVAQSRKGIFVSQRKYVPDLLKETGMHECNPIDTLMDSTTKLGAKEDSNSVHEQSNQRTHGGYASNPKMPKDDTNEGPILQEDGNLVTWQSKKQFIVSRSSAKYKFRAMAQGMFEGIWLTRTLRELRISIEKPMKMFCDKQSAISIAKNLVHHDRTKPMEIDHHFIKEK